jgi:hypothetical protein
VGYQKIDIWERRFGDNYQRLNGDGKEWDITFAIVLLIHGFIVSWSQGYIVFKTIQVNNHATMQP